jgi:hypothetical protein
MPARYSADLLSINLPLHFILLGLWGIPWLLVGYVVFSFATKQKQVVLGKASAVVP